ncbi:hypothetical protein HK414_16155 [Ramlibacter terrae]|uniref:Uncharacterized protein n=1 Tax=Ramlibacter terrae TaxID=2732511 RepID=A0ABX6P3M3_9BURK|nr:hypothetical protein HK414_16155 [Ramlibacter terrae]
MQAEGDLFPDKRNREVTLSDGTVLQTDMLAIAGADIDAFVGVDGGTDGATGLQIEDFDFALAMFTAKDDATRSWTSLQASAGAAGPGRRRRGHRQGDQRPVFVNRPRCPTTKWWTSPPTRPF